MPGMSYTNHAEVKQLLLDEAESIQDGDTPDVDSETLVALAKDDQTEPEVVAVLEDLNWNLNSESLEVALAGRADVGVRDHYAYSDYFSVVAAYVSNPAVPVEALHLVNDALIGSDYYNDFTDEEKEELAKTVQTRLS